MTVYPLIIHVGPLMVTGFGIMMMVAFLMAGWAIQLRLRGMSLSIAYAEHIVVAAVIGGILGSKLWYVILHQDYSQFFSRGGLVWYGGFVGGTAAVLLNGWRERVPARFTLEISAAALPLGHGLGRVGCFLVQDDYGIPTSLPWGMRFPQGYPPSTAQNMRAWNIDVPADALPTDVLAVHPTQLYEVAALLFIFWLIWRLRNHNRGTGWLFSVYLICAGIERFLVEFIRAKDDRMLGMFTLAQATSLVVLALGIILMGAWWKKDRSQLPTEAAILNEPKVKQSHSRA
jgi:phosphatidylglycerol:prolipoprotein diacylglycerol transferase